MKGAERDDNDSIGDIKTNYLTVDNYICNPCRVRSCKTKRYRGYNRVVHTLDHMRNRTEVKHSAASAVPSRILVSTDVMIRTVMNTRRNAQIM